MAMALTRDNYHSLEADREYMSHSQYLGFLDCEARQMAKQCGQWVDEKSNTFLVGQYVHAWNEGKRREFIAECPEMFTKGGGLRSEFKTADCMIETLEKDPFAMYVLEGQKEVILTAEYAGALWKIRMDTYNPERRRIVDLKTTRSIREKQWSDEAKAKVNFLEQYRYFVQTAIYCEIERIASGRQYGDWLDYFVVAVSKDDFPDKEVIFMGDSPRYENELAEIQTNMPRILQVKSGQVEPVRCERCDYCRSTKVLSAAIHYSEL